MRLSMLSDTIIILDPFDDVPLVGGFTFCKYLLSNNKEFIIERNKGAYLKFFQILFKEREMTSYNSRHAYLILFHRVFCTTV